MMLDEGLFQLPMTAGANISYKMNSGAKKYFIVSFMILKKEKTVFGLRIFMGLPGICKMASSIV